ncbi:divalent metal cation transporter [Vulcanimicrobium alpinum]|uniref:divalent metal cation transporter n=1 Tax=Vulcanimicrobium alpinum TaxID=3016050 RepID=UPI0038643EA8
MRAGRTAAYPLGIRGAGCSTRISPRISSSSQPPSRCTSAASPTSPPPPRPRARFVRWRGRFASTLFAGGILGVGLIGVPVLAGSAAYALSEAIGWKEVLERKATGARGFYGVLSVSVLYGLVVQYSPISPMKALFWSAVIDGVVAVRSWS